MLRNKHNKPQGLGDLNYRQKLFCLEYMKDLNGTEAAKRAGYSKDTAFSIATENLKKPYIKKEVDRLFEERAARQLITAEMILLELLAIARIDPSEAFDNQGNLKDLKDMPVALRKCISAIEIEEEFGKGNDKKKKCGYVKKVRFWNKNDALNTLAKHLKLISDNTNILLPGSKLIFQDVKIDANATPETLFKDINNRLALQHEEAK